MRSIAPRNRMNANAITRREINRVQSSIKIDKIDKIEPPLRTSPSRFFVVAWSAPSIIHVFYKFGIHEWRSKYPGIGFDKAVFFGRANLTPFKLFSRKKRKKKSILSFFTTINRNERMERRVSAPRSCFTRTSLIVHWCTLPSTEPRYHLCNDFASSSTDGMNFATQL